ncbi:pirin family protein [Pseudomonas sp. CGJS7]|uniref:pirin family protein n=1 Tax=Pseudomonas sp. CGJS7 TaxID=3109348 RepID=UPI0030090004
MIIERLSDARGRVRAGWLDSRHTFSFGSYYDPAWMGFGCLRVINEDRVDPGAGFAPHRHANMEILSYVLSGGLAHQDSTGGGGTIRPGELQWMSAGHGVEHSEFNASKTEPVHFLQIWVQPDRLNAQPAYAQPAAVEAKDGEFVLRASRDGVEGGVPIRQDVKLYSLGLAQGTQARRSLESGRMYWLQVAQGRIEANGRVLQAGDALGFADESGELLLTGSGDSVADVLWFDLPVVG